MAFIMASDSKTFGTFSKKEKATTAEEIINLFTCKQGQSLNKFYRILAILGLVSSGFPFKIILSLLKYF